MTRSIRSMNLKLLPVVTIWLLYSGVSPGTADDHDESSPIATAVDASQSDDPRGAEQTNELALDSDQNLEKSESTDEKKDDPGNASEKTLTKLDQVVENVGDSRIYPSLPIRQITLKPGVNPEKYASFLMDLGFHTIYLSPEGNTLFLRWADDEEEQSIKSVLTQLGVVATPQPNTPSRIPDDAHSSTAERTAGAAATPETRALRLQLLAVESRAEVIAEEIRRGLPQSELTKTRQKLDAHLTDALLLKVQLEELEIKGFEQRLAELKSQIRRRKSVSKQIVQRRAQELIHGDASKSIGRPSSLSVDGEPVQSVAQIEGVRPDFQSMIGNPRSRRRGRIRSDQRSEPEKKKIFIAKNEIEIGMALDDSNTEFKDCPADLVPEDVVSEAEEFSGRVARVVIPAKSMIFRTNLGPKRKVGVSAQVPEGMTLVALPINRTEIGLIRPGVFVNVLCAIKFPASGGRRERTLVKRVARKLQVVSVGENSLGGAPNSPEGAPVELHEGVIGLIAPPNEATILNLAKDMSQKRLTYELVSEPANERSMSGSEAEDLYKELDDAYREIQSRFAANDRTTDPEKEFPQSDVQISIPFGQLVVNLNEPNLSKFLSIDFSAQTTKQLEDKVKHDIEGNKLRLKSQILALLAEKSIEDVRGKQGLGSVRTELLNTLNEILYKDQEPPITDILFEEFHVQ